MASRTTPKLGGRCGLLVCFIVLLAFKALGHVASPSRPRLSANVNDWEYFANAPGFQHTEFPYGGRFWDRSLLRSAVATVNTQHLQGLIAKLNAGQPITVMALGSSITCGFGGDFEPRPGMIASRVPVPRPRHPLWKEGFLRMFMHMINTTWPHPDHLLYNMGRHAHSILLYASGSCMEASMPNSTVDLTILELLPEMKRAPAEYYFSEKHYQTNGALMEQLFRRLTLHFSTLVPPAIPPMIVLKSMPAKTNGVGFFSCFTSGCKYKACKLYQGLLNQPGRDVVSEWMSEERMHGIVKFYGHTGLSLRYLYQAAQRDQAFRNVSDCVVTRRLYADLVHPSILGQMMLADMLISLLADVEATALGPSDSEDSQHDGGAAGGAAIPLLPPHSMFPGGQQVWQSRCYGDVPPNDLHRNFNVKGNKEEGNQLITQGVQPIHVLNATGWYYVTHEKNLRRPGAPPKPAPGWMAQEVGATLTFQVDTLFVDEHQPDKPKVEVVTTYLRSYEHMGTAHFSCVSGCQCPGNFIDAHDDEPVSVSMTAALKHVTQHPACVVQVKVIPQSRSPGQEHKFKLIEVIVKGFV